MIEVGDYELVEHGGRYVSCAFSMGVGCEACSVRDNDEFQCGVRTVFKKKVKGAEMNNIEKLKKEHKEMGETIKRMEEEEKAVGEIQECLGLHQAIVSQHLAKMRGCNIVEARRDGTHVYYRIIEPKVHLILDCIRHCDLKFDLA